MSQFWDASTTVPMINLHAWESRMREDGYTVVFFKLNNGCQTWLVAKVGQPWITNLQAMWTDEWVKSKCKQDSQNVCTKLLSLPDNTLPYSGLSRAVCTVHVNQIAEFSYVTLITLWPILCTSWCFAVWQSSDHVWCCWEKEWGVKSSLIGEADEGLT